MSKGLICKKAFCGGVDHPDNTDVYSSSIKAVILTYLALDSLMVELHPSSINIYIYL